VSAGDRQWDTDLEVSRCSLCSSVYVTWGKCHISEDHRNTWRCHDLERLTTYNIPTHRHTDTHTDRHTGITLNRGCQSARSSVIMPSTRTTAGRNTLQSWTRPGDMEQPRGWTVDIIGVPWCSQKTQLTCSASWAGELSFLSYLQTVKQLLWYAIQRTRPQRRNCDHTITVSMPGTHSHTHYVQSR